METARAFENRVFDISKGSSSIYEPLSVQVLGVPTGGKGDIEVLIGLGGKKVEFEAEIVNRTSPQLLELKLLKATPQGTNRSYLLIVPYLSESVVALLKRSNVSGLDLNGNYYIVTPDIVAIRLDRKNEFKESATIKKIYSGTSSVVGRYLVEVDQIPCTINEIANDISNKGGNISLSTVSKVLNRLNDELIISKKREIQILQREVLLDNLVNSYIQPRELQTIKLKVPEDALDFLRTKLGKQEGWSLTGISSADKYTLAPSVQAVEVYLKRVSSEWLRWEDNRFYNIVLKEIDDDFVYFNSALEKNVRYSSKLQSYIELARGDKREKEIAEEMKRDFLGVGNG